MTRLTQSLRSKLLLLLVLASVVPLGVATLLAVRNSRATVQTQVGSAQARIAAQVAQRLDLLMLERALEIEGLSSDGTLAAAALGMGDSATTRATLARVAARSEIIRAVRLYDADGVAIAASDDEAHRDAGSGAGTEWIRGATDTGHVYVGPVERDARGRLGVRIAEGVRTPTGDVLGFVTADLDWAAVTREAFAALEKSYHDAGVLSARVYLVDSVGGIVGATNADEVLRDRVTTPEVLAAITERAAGSTVAALAGAEQLVAYAPLRRERTEQRYAGMLGNHASIIVAEHAVEAFRGATALRTQLILVSLVAAAIVALFAWWMAGRIARPLSDAAALAEALAVGDTTRDIAAIDSVDETGRLNVALRHLVTYLRGLTAASERVAAGDVHVALEPKSDRDELSRAFITVARTNAEVIEAVGGITRAALDGQLSARGDASRFRGSYAELVTGVNRTLDAVMEPIGEASRVLQQLAQRDLTARVQGSYKGDHARITDALNKAAANLDAALTEVWATAEQVAAASGQIGTGSHALAEGANEQASTLEEVSSSLQELTSRTRQNAGNAQTARSLADEARTSAETGSAGMGRLQDAMGRIKASSDATAKIVKTIDEIAFQTNLLALNAAVEAARAGDAGRGFAVVAEEVRALALRSAEAAKNTAALIEEAVQNAEGGVTINGEVIRQLGDINTRIVKVREVMGEIAGASEEQSSGVAQISQAVEQMNAVTQQVAANSQESAATAQQLSAQATALRTTLGRFTLSAATRGPSGAPPAGGSGTSRSPSASAPRAAAPVRPSRGTPVRGTRPVIAAPRPATNGNGKHAPAPVGNGRPAGHANGGAPAPNGRGVASVDPSRVIPFDEDEDLDVLGEF